MVCAVKSRVWSSWASPPRVHIILYCIIILQYGYTSPRHPVRYTIWLDDREEPGPMFYFLLLFITTMLTILRFSITPGNVGTLYISEIDFWIPRRDCCAPLVCTQYNTMCTWPSQSNRECSPSSAVAAASKVYYRSSLD